MEKWDTNSKLGESGSLTEGKESDKTWRLVVLGEKALQIRETTEVKLEVGEESLFPSERSYILFVGSQVYSTLG